jgi:hypothetical protein
MIKIFSIILVSLLLLSPTVQSVPEDRDLLKNIESFIGIGISNIATFFNLLILGVSKFFADYITHDKATSFKIDEDMARITTMNELYNDQILKGCCKTADCYLKNEAVCITNCEDCNIVREKLEKALK